jgi:hypothetical protein
VSTTTTTTTINLFGHRENGLNITAKVLRLLEHFGHDFKVIGSALDTIIIQGGYSLQYRWFSLCDNGGEINVGKINAGELPVSVATECALAPTPPNAETVALRLSDAILGRPIDYENVETDGSLDCILEPRHTTGQPCAYAVPAPPGESQASYSARAAGFVGDPRPLETRREFPDE